MQNLTWIFITAIGFFLLQACQTEENHAEMSELGFQKDLLPLLDENNIRRQIFTINAAQDTSLIGDKGTIINIPANCFVNIKSGNIEVELIEAPTLRDMILLNAQTVSNGRPLETGGIIYLNATEAGLQLNANKPIEIKILAETIDPTMEAFVGSYDENGMMNWIEGNKMTFDTTSEYNKMISSGMFEIPFAQFPYRAKYYERDSIAKEYPKKRGVVQATVVGYLIDPEMANFYKKLIKIIESEKYAGTHLATREFAERLYRLQYIDHAYHWRELTTLIIGESQEQMVCSSFPMMNLRNMHMNL